MTPQAYLKQPEQLNKLPGITHPSTAPAGNFVDHKLGCLNQAEEVFIPDGKRHEAHVN